MPGAVEGRVEGPRTRPPGVGRLVEKVLGTKVFDSFLHAPLLLEEVDDDMEATIRRATAGTQQCSIHEAAQCGVAVQAQKRNTLESG